MSIQQNNMYTANREQVFAISAYPVDLSAFLMISEDMLDANGRDKSGPYHVAFYALTHWNQYLADHEEEHRHSFLRQADWFVEHEIHIDDYSSGWPISFPHQ